MTRWTVVAVLVVVCAFSSGVCLATGADDTGHWETISAGMQLGTFTGPESALGDSRIHVLRIDPEFWELKIMGISEIDAANVYSPMRWCEEYGFSAAINAGMYAMDYSTHVGYMQSGLHVNEHRMNHYKSVAAFGPKRDDLPLFRIYDLDDGGVNVEDIVNGYEYVVQNLRMIKRRGENRWSRQEKMWSEVALGEDEDGRILFIFCRTPYTVYEFNEVLMSLPIDLVCAQHLDGGPVAEMVILTDEVRREFIGSYETGCCEYTTNTRAYPLPNIMGVVPREQQEP